MRETRQKVEYGIRAMEERDIPQVLDIDREAFPTQWPYPTYSSFKQELRNRLAHYIVACKPDEAAAGWPPAAMAEDQKKNNNKGILSKLLDLKHLWQQVDATKDTLPPPAREFVLGMAGFWLMVGEAHIITIAVRKSFRNLGIGEKMLISAIDKAIMLNANMVTLEVRISNNGAQELYKKYGFVPAGMRQKYYTDNSENALIMSTENIMLPSYSEKLHNLKEAHFDRWGN